MRRYAALVILVLFPMFSVAQDKPFKVHNSYKIFYSAFNSTFIDPNIAVTYKITRGKDKGLVNIAVINSDSTGKTAQVSGYVSNIFQQSQRLEFFEVREQDAVYYLSPFNFENEDHLTFNIEVTPDAGAPAYTFKFQKTMYHD